MVEETNSTRVAFNPSLEPPQGSVPESSHASDGKLTPHEQLMRQMEQNNGPKQAGEKPGSGVSDEVLCERVAEALKTVYDPEIPVNIYDLGLIYRVEINNGFAEVDMTLTAPGCPVAHTFPGMVEGTVKLVPGIKDAVVDLVWDPPWRQDMISEAAQLELGLI